MLTVNGMALRRAKRARQRAMATMQAIAPLADQVSGETPSANASLVRDIASLIDDWRIDGLPAGLPVTLEGFVTMALLPDQARRVGNSIAIPGIDDAGRCGHLVVEPGRRPYHSALLDPQGAVSEAREALRRAGALEAAFGGRVGLREACAKAGWLTRVTLADASAAGLCDWGIRVFLERHRLWRLANVYGVPKCLLWFGGKYPRRALAAALLRQRSSDPQRRVLALSRGDR